MASTVVDFIRHGQPLGGRLYRGSAVDDELGPLGWEQMKAAVGAAASWPWSRVVSSPLQRCSGFAFWLQQQSSGALPVAVEADFREVGFGDWEGMSREQLLAQREAEFRAFYADPVGARPPGAESLQAFGERVGAGFERLLQASAGEHVLVVAHAGVIRAVLGLVLQAEPVCWYRTTVVNAGLTRFVVDEAGARSLVFLNRPSLEGL